jgi:YD repeat-containing protein
MTPDGQVIDYDYAWVNLTGRRLTQVRYPDGATRSFHYENPAYPYALTGISINGERHATYAYDSTGRAINTVQAGGVDAYQVAYSGGVGDPVTVTDPLGTARNYGYGTNLGKVTVTSASLPPAGYAGGVLNRVQNSFGLIDSETDFLGYQTLFTWDTTRRVPTRTRRAVNTSEETTITSDWHPTQRVPVRQSTPGVLTTSVYNGQPDPFNGGAVASCAPAGAVLPDTSPIVVLCKRVEQATTDANGALGLTAPLQSGVPARVWQWTYNADAQALSETDPLGRMTSYTYYADTTATANRGDLQTVGNAVGHVTRYTAYNGAGNVLQSLDPNGVATDYTYDVRQRLTGTSMGGQVTSYVYTPSGQLSQVNLPNGSAVLYSYDPAQRLIGVADTAGNRIAYTLDNAGNRTVESLQDPGGTLSRQVSRVFDALGRVQTAFGQE